MWGMVTTTISPSLSAERIWRNFRQTLVIHPPISCPSLSYPSFPVHAFVPSGSFMIRRIVGIAGVADLEGISDDHARAACERRALLTGLRLLKQVLVQDVKDVDALVALVAQAARP